MGFEIQTFSAFHHASKSQTRNVTEHHCRAVGLLADITLLLLQGTTNDLTKETLSFSHDLACG